MYQSSRISNIALTSAVVVFAALLANRPANGDIFAPTDQWNVVSYSGPNQFDYLDDQQTGNRDSDIVGNGQHPAFYMQFDDLGTGSVIDGTWDIRVRLGSDRPGVGTFDNNLFVGIDGDLDGSIDLFFGINNQGSNELISIWDAGTGANVSPSTTSIVSPPLYSVAETATNYDFVAVDGTNDPTATSFDLDADGQTDFFLSFSIDFAEIVTYMNSASGLSIDETTQMSFVLATANNDNSLNQDLNGADGGIGSSLTWSELGVMSNPFSMVAIPEPSGVLPTTVALLALVGWRKRKPVNGQYA